MGSGGGGVAVSVFCAIFRFDIFVACRVVSECGVGLVGWFKCVHVVIHDTVQCSTYTYEGEVDMIYRDMICTRCCDFEGFLYSAVYGRSVILYELTVSNDILFY